MATIEGDIRKLIEEEFEGQKFDLLLNPPDNFVWQQFSFQIYSSEIEF